MVLINEKLSCKFIQFTQKRFSYSTCKFRTLNKVFVIFCTLYYYNNFPVFILVAENCDSSLEEISNAYVSLQSISPQHTQIFRQIFRNRTRNGKFPSPA